jgi:RNA polymerase sigma factor (sigma-70 family)
VVAPGSGAGERRRGARAQIQGDLCEYGTNRSPDGVNIDEMANRHDLVIAAKAGDGDAFMDLVQLETPDAYRLSLTILRHPFDAEDALQDAFVRAWRLLPGLREVEQWQAWFRRIAVNTAIDTGRRRKALRIVPLGFHEPPPAADGSAGLADRDEVGRAMGHLDAKDRALLALRFGQDLELPDVAAALGIPLGTAKSRLHRALGRLRKELESVDELEQHRGSSSGQTEYRIKRASAEPRV